MEEQNNNNQELDLSLIKLEKHLKINELQNNSVVLLKLAEEITPEVVMALQTLAGRYKEQFKEKNISLLVIPPNSSVEELDEKSMEKAGWIKKDKKRIITLN